MKKTLFVLLVMVVLLSVASPVEAKKPTPSWDVVVTPNPHNPGEPIQIEISVNGTRGKETNFSFQVSYGNGPWYLSWWGGMSGPAYSVQGFSDQTWMECSYYGGCTEWWEGRLPKGKNTTPYDVVVIPLTTSSLSGCWENAITVEMTLNEAIETKSILIISN